MGSSIMGDVNVNRVNPMKRVPPHKDDDENKKKKQSNKEQEKEEKEEKQSKQEDSFVESEKEKSEETPKTKTGYTMDWLTLNQIKNKDSDRSQEPGK